MNANGELQPISDAFFTVSSAGADPQALAPTLRREVSNARSAFRVSNARAQAELVRAQTLRERLLALLALFFATVAILLAGVGLCGVLDYSVLQRRREIGIRVAIGAQAGDVAQGVTTDAFLMVLAGSIAGLAIGVASSRYIEGLLYHVNATDPGMLALPWLLILFVALLAVIPAVMRAVSIDPVAALRAE